MVVRLGRFRWRAPRPDDGATPATAGEADGFLVVADPPDGHATPDSPDTTPAATSPPSTPEQPIPLAPLRDGERPRVGVLLPVRRPRSLVPALPLPRVPKRAIFAIGICAGLAVPGVTRQLAGRALVAAFGGDRAAPPAQAVERATLEVIRVTVSATQRGQAAATVGKLLEALR
jgi:hypothetical protein